MKGKGSGIRKQMPVYGIMLFVSVCTALFFAVPCAGAQTDIGLYAVKNRFSSDNKLPEISITAPDPDSASNAIDNIYYFNTRQTFQVTVTDEDLDADRSKIFYTITQDGQTVDHAVSLGSESAVRTGNAVYAVEIPVTDGQELSGLRVSARDCAKQKAEDCSLENNRYIVDTTAPEAELIVSGDGVESFFTNDTDVYVKFDPAAFSDGGSGVSGPAQTVTLQITVTDRNLCIDCSGNFKNENYVENELSNGIEWKGTAGLNTESAVTYTQSMTVDPGSTGELQFQVTVRDLAGNAVGDFTTNLPDEMKEQWHRDKKGTIRGKVIGDLQVPAGGEDERQAPVMTMLPKQDPAAFLEGEIPLYADSMCYVLMVSDPVFTDGQGRSQYSGLASVTWSVRTDQAELIYTTNNEHSYAGERSAKLTVPVIIDGVGEADDVTVIVTATDRAGNTSVLEKRLAMDNEKPRVTINYDNQDVHAGKYFNRSRKATILVEDMNFDPDRTGIRTEGIVSGWDRDGNTYTATVSFDTDGDYLFEMFSEDKAGNNAEIDYSDRGKNAAPQAFTIDQTKPEIRIIFDPEDSGHGRYYNKSRTAKIRIIEHNFDPGAAGIQVKAALGGISIEAPEADGWTDREEAHETEITFIKDGDYSGTISCTDLAGNEADVRVMEEFTIDRTPPKVEIFDVRNAAGYAGPLSFRIRVYDSNYDENGCRIDWTFTGRNEEELSIENTGEAVRIIRDRKTQGMELRFANREAEPENDGIYRICAVVTDLAGNTAYLSDEEGTVFPDGICYSLNRFGSIYDVQGEEKGFPETEELLSTRYTNTAPEIFVRESNPGRLKDLQVSIAAEGTVRMLEEGEEYEIIRRTEGKGEWQRYIWHIFESAFRETSGELIQGEVTITLYSEDTAGNLNSNRTNESENGLDLSFVIDNEPPSGYINIAGLSEGSDTVRAAHTGVTCFWEDNNGVGKVELFLNNELKETVTGDGLAKGSAELTVPEDRKKQTAYAAITDAAGNRTVLKPSEFYVRSSGRSFLRNKPILFGTVSGILFTLAGVKAALTVKRRKRKRNPQQRDSAS